MFLVIWRILTLICSIFEYSAVINFVKIMTTKQFQIQEGRKIFKTCKPEMPMGKRIEKLMKSGIATNCIPIILDHINPKVVYNYVKQILTRKPKWLDKIVPLEPSKALKEKLSESKNTCPWTEKQINKLYQEAKVARKKKQEQKRLKSQFQIKIRKFSSKKFKAKIKKIRKVREKSTYRRKYELPPDMPKKLLYNVVTRTNNFKNKSFITVDYDHVDVWNHIKANPYCYITGEYIDILKPNSFSLDHFVAPCKGGSSNLYNMRICKPIFNTMKWDQNFDDFVENCQKVIEFQKSIYLD